MTYKLFIDDLRSPTGEGWQIARSYEGAIRIVSSYGAPTFVSFDNDLGEGLEGYDFSKWLIDQDLEQEGKFLPTTFDFQVHSANIVAVKNIENLLRNYLRLKNNESSIHTK